MHTMKKFFSIAMPTMVLFAIVFSLTVSAQTALPDCVKNLSSLKQTSNDTNAYYYNDEVHGKVELYISNNRFFITSTGVKGTWRCESATRLSLAPDRTAPSSPSTGGVNGVTPDNNVEQTSTPCVGANCDSTQPTDFHLNVKLDNPLKVKTIQGAIQLFMNTVVKIAIPFIIVFFIFAGFKFILARGNSTELQTAKHMFFYTLIGALLIFGAWAITNAIVGTINSISS
jgi:hypothetical protein